MIKEVIQTERNRFSCERARFFNKLIIKRGDHFKGDLLLFFVFSGLKNIGKFVILLNMAHKTPTQLTSRTNQKSSCVFYLLRIMKVVHSRFFFLLLLVVKTNSFAAEDCARESSPLNRLGVTPVRQLSEMTSQIDREETPINSAQSPSSNNEQISNQSRELIQRFCDVTSRRKFGSQQSANESLNLWRQSGRGPQGPAERERHLAQHREAINELFGRVQRQQLCREGYIPNPLPPDVEGFIRPFCLLSGMNLTGSLESDFQISEVPGGFAEPPANETVVRRYREAQKVYSLKDKRTGHETHILTYVVSAPTDSIAGVMHFTPLRRTRRGFEPYRSAQPCNSNAIQFVPAGM